MISPLSVIQIIADRDAQIAQLVEQRTENPRVAGSIPALGIFYFLITRARLKNYPRNLPQIVTHILQKDFFRHALEKSRPRRGGLIYFVSILSNVSFSISLDVTCIA